MSYVASASGVSTGGNDTVTVSDPGLSNGDMIILAVIVNEGDSWTITWPSGFTQFATADNSGADRGSANFMALAWSTTKASSYAITVQGGDGTTPALIVVGNSGRSLSAPSLYQANNNVSGGSSPITVGLSGPTGVPSGADVLWLGAVNDAASWSWTAPSGYTSRQSQSITATGGGSVNLSSLDDSSGGSLGTLSGTATSSGQNADCYGIVVALAPASASASLYLRRRRGKGL